MLFLFNAQIKIFKDEDTIADLRRALSESEMRNEGINREFQKLLRQKEVRKNTSLHVLVKHSCCVRYFDIGTSNN